MGHCGLKFGWLGAPDGLDAPDGLVPGQTAARFDTEASEPIGFPLGDDRHFIEVRMISGFRVSGAEVGNDGCSELQNSAAHGLVGRRPSHCQAS